MVDFLDAQQDLLKLQIAGFDGVSELHLSVVHLDQWGLHGVREGPAEFEGAVGELFARNVLVHEFGGFGQEVGLCLVVQLQFEDSLQFQDVLLESFRDTVQLYQDFCGHIYFNLSFLLKYGVN
jgi:hypothetical protein